MTGSAAPDAAAALSSAGDAALSHEARVKRAQWRAAHRGTKEMDIMLGGYAAATLATMSAAELDRFEQLLLLPDPDLQRWLIDPASEGNPDFAPEIAAIRQFHDPSA